MKKSHVAWIVVLSILAVLGGLIWFSVHTFMGLFKDTQNFWAEWESKSQAELVVIAQDCDKILVRYQRQKTFPVAVPIEDPAITSDAIRKTQPKGITMWGHRRISLIMVQTGPNQGLMVTRERPSTEYPKGRILLGGTSEDGVVVYPK